MRPLLPTLALLVAAAGAIASAEVHFATMTRAEIAAAAGAH